MPEVSERSSQKRQRTDASGTADTSLPLLRWSGGWVALLVTMMARAILATLAVLLLITLAPALFGWHPTVVSSGSMEPRLMVGDVVVSRPIGSAPLELHQDILEKDPNHVGWLRLHRFVGVTGSGQVITKGDANPGRDTASVPMSDVIGIASLRVPYLGLPAVWLGSGQFGKIAVTATALALLIWCSLLFRQDESHGENEQPRKSGRRARADRRTHRRKPKPLSAGVVSSRIGAASVIGILVSLVPALPADAASFANTTSNASNALASATRFSCSDRVIADSPANYYKLTETAGLTAADSSGNSHPGTYSSTGVTYGATGPCAIDGATAVTLNGGATTGITTANAVSAPTTFSVEMWFKTTSIAGGLLMGMYTDPTSAAASQDRVLYLTTTGKIAFGMFNNSTLSAVSATSPLSYNDGAWHLADATYTASGGITVYVDGTSVATNTAAIPANTFTGYWRIGYGGLVFWPGAPILGNGLAGTIASAAVYSQSLSPTQVSAHYSSTRGTCARTVLSNSPSNYYKLNENSGTTAADSSGNSIPGTYTAGVTYGAAGPCSVDGATGVTLNGANAGITTSNPIPRPTTFSFEIWVKSSTTTGGLLMAVFGDPTAPAPGPRDPVLYMTNTGTIHFGMYDSFGSQTYDVESSGTFNNGAWHLIDATYSDTAKMTLYVDGVSVGTNPGLPHDNFTGYLRIGYGNLSGWPNTPTSGGFTGSIASAALYPTVLSAAQIAANYAAR